MTDKDQVSSLRSPISIRLHEPTFGEEEIAAVVEVMRSKQITSGAKVREFERKFSPRAVMCNSGSSANLLAVAASMEIELNRGDEVIVPALSWSTTVWPIVQYGLVPVIVDIDPRTLNIDPTKMLNAISPRTKGIDVVHVYGNPCDMSAITTLARDAGLWLMEDCCEALGASWHGSPVGTFGDVSTFSFYFSHHITTGEGGLCDTHDPVIAERMRMLRAHGWIRDCVNFDQYIGAYLDIDPRFLFLMDGYNLRCTEMQAAMGLVQLEKLPGFVQRRRAVADMLIRIFERYSYSIAVQEEQGTSSWFGFPIIVKDGAPFSSKSLRLWFEQHAIETRSIICGNIARQPGMKARRHIVPFPLDNADHVMRNGFSIGCHQGMDEASCERVREVVEAFMGNYA